MNLSRKTTNVRFYVCNFAVSLDGFANVHRLSADMHFKLTRDFVLLNCNMDKLKEIYKEMYQAMIAKDTEVLEQLLDEDFVLIHIAKLHSKSSLYVFNFSPKFLHFAEKC